MKSETLTALKGSIKKWKDIVSNEGIDHRGDNCPLCKLFAYRLPACSGCPVKAKTGHAGCEGSPWVEWSIPQPLMGTWIANTPERMRLAKAELKFLRSLLPKKSAPKKKAARKP